jgi:hypothetical protein
MKSPKKVTIADVADLHEAERNGMAVDPEKVQWLVDAMSEVVVEELEGNPASHSEVVSALFTLLNSCLNAIRKMPPSDAKRHNTTLINQTLIGLMIAPDRTH